MISKNIMKIVANVNPTNRSLVRKFIISKGKTFELERQIQFEFFRSYKFLNYLGGGYVGPWI